MIYQDFQNFKNGHQIWLTYQIPEEKRDFTIIIEDPSAFEFMKSFEIPKIIDSVNLPNESIRLILATALGHL
jgi:C4-type Zn-finger protein